MTAVFFTVDSEMCGSVRCAGQRRFRLRKKYVREYDIRSKTVEKDGARLHWIEVTLPARERKKREWTANNWAQYVDGLDIPPEGRNIYYLPDAEAGRMLGRTPEPLSGEWILFLMEYYKPVFDGLIVLQDREMEAEDLILRHARKTRYLGVATANAENWQDIVEDLSEEYGFMLDVAEKFKGLHFHGENLLIIAGNETYQAAPALLPKGSVWLSTDVAGEAGRKICSRAENVRYLSLRGFLREMSTGVPDPAAG
ncbi:MAG: hypothetical protein HDR26_01780 [Lachnospiraceae bacterium]|nr:hypothetical protein [Lachnospiraceae bacterium]